MAYQDEGFLPWISRYASTKSYMLFRIIGIITDIEGYYYSISGSSRKLSELSIAETTCLLKELQSDQRLRKRQKIVHQQMITILKLYLAYKQNRTHQLSRLEVTLDIKYLNSLRWQPLPPEEDPPVSPKIAEPFTNPSPRKREPLTNPLQPRNHGTASISIISKPQRPEPVNYKPEKRKLVYKAQIPAVKQYVPDPLHELHREPEFNCTYSSYQRIYNEIIRRAPALKPCIDDIKLLPRPKAGEVEQRTKLYISGNKSQLDILLPYYFRTCLKAALRISIKNQTDLADTVSESFFQLMQIMPNLIMNRNISFLALNLERALSREPAPVWMWFTLPINERKNARIIREILDNSCPDTHEANYFASSIKEYINSAFPNGLQNTNSLAECIQNVYLQDIQYLDKPITRSEASKALHVSEYELQRYYDYQSEDGIPEPLETPFDGTTLADIIYDETEYFENTEPYDKLYHSLSKLTPRGLTVLCLRYGLNGNKEHTLEEIGYYFSLTRERIRQLEAKAIRTIRYYYNRYKGADRKAFMQEYEAKMIEVQKFIDENNYKYEAKMNMYSRKGKREYIKPDNDVDERQQSILLDFFTAGLSSL